jgi:hypothetical protein
MVAQQYQKNRQTFSHPALASPSEFSPKIFLFRYEHKDLKEASAIGLYRVAAKM